MSKKIEIGDTFIVEMLQNKKHKNQPICRCNGRVGFLNPSTIEKPIVGETWTVSVIEIQSTFIIVEPCFLEMSKAETEVHKLALMAKLISTKQIVHKKVKKVKKSFPYLSKNEIS